MHVTEVVKKPLVTEKNTFHSDAFNRYAFQVDPRASKPQIKKAVETLYDVRVVGVNTQNRKGEMRRNKFGYWRTSSIKVATIKVHPDDRIELF